MPVAKLVKKIYDSKSLKTIEYMQDCILLKEKDLWVVLDPETNNELISGVSKEFIKNEIKNERLIVDDPRFID